jgi:hypothetical protein
MQSTHVEVECCFGKCYAVSREGIIDHDAKQAFTRGQCHALALALHRLTGWQLYGLYRPHELRRGTTPSHTVVRTPDGEYIDINGNNALEEWRKYYHEAEPKAVTEAQVLAFEEDDYCKPDIKAAMPFAVTLYVKYGKGQATQMRLPFAV